MDKVGQKLVRNLKSRKYEVMDGTNNPDRVETLQIGRFSPDAYSERGGDDHNHNHHQNTGDFPEGRNPFRGNDIEMTAAVSGVVPDGKILFWKH